MLIVHGRPAAAVPDAAFARVGMPLLAIVVAAAIFPMEGPDFVGILATDLAVTVTLAVIGFDSDVIVAAFYATFFSAPAVLPERMTVVNHLTVGIAVSDPQTVEYSADVPVQALSVDQGCDLLQENWIIDSHPKYKF